MSYQKINLATGEIVGPVGLPAALKGLGNETLADLSAVLDPCPPDFDGYGYLPIAPAGDVPVGKVSEGLTVTMGDDGPVYVHTLRDMTEAEVLETLPYKTAKEARLAMVAWIDALTAQVLDEYPAAVQARWDIEEEAARAVLAGNATSDQTTLITREGATKARTPEQHAQRIIDHADRFRNIADQINTLFLAVGAQIEAAGPEEYEGILQAAIASAAPLAEAYGLE